MRRFSIALIVLLLAIAYGYADGYQAEEAVNREKERQLEKVAERFKAEAKFVGEINFNYTQMKLGSFEGKFADIPFSAKEDTTAFRQACERILDKILPYSLAKRSQLPMKRITRNGNYTETIYHQTVNGYRVENSGFIVITYDAGRNRFDIGDNTVELPEENITPVLTYEDAVRIYDDNVKDSEAIKKFRKRRPFLVLRYSNIYNDREGDTRREYRLCWIGGYTRTIFIDAQTGKVYRVVSNTSPDLDVSITVDVLLESDNSGSLTATSVPLDSTYVSAVCDSIKYERFTNNSGHYCFQGTVIPPDSLKSKLKSRCGIEVLTNTLEDIFQSSINLPNLNFNFCSPDTFGNPSNLYYHAIRFRDNIRNLGLSYIKTDSLLQCLDICANYTLTSGTNGECHSSSDGQTFIYISPGNGKYNSALCHEMTHDFVYRYFNNNQFVNYDTTHTNTKDAMDEAFSSYFPCMYRNNSNYRSQYYDKDLSTLLTVSNVQTAEYSSSTINEDIYSFYHMRFPLASAWWSLRGNQLFPADNQNRNGVDTLLVAGLDKVKQDINVNAAYRYKPRYFYNILMSRVDDDNKAWPPNAKQAAIDKAYADRGFYFTPKVISARSFNAQKESDIFKKGDSIYVTISHCPQNTPLKIYVVRDQSYTDGMGFGSLAQNSIIRTQTVSATEIGDTGQWSGSITGSTTLDAGNYDILVDIGINGRFHFVYKDANILDGFDGLYRPGFTVYDYGDSLYVEDLNDIFEADLESDLEFVHTNIDFTKKFKKIEPDDTGVVFNGLTGATFCENAEDLKIQLFNRIQATIVKPN